MIPNKKSSVFLCYFFSERFAFEKGKARGGPNGAENCVFPALLGPYGLKCKQSQTEKPSEKPVWPQGWTAGIRAFFRNKKEARHGKGAPLWGGEENTATATAVSPDGKYVNSECRKAPGSGQLSRRAGPPSRGASFRHGPDD